MPIHLSKATNPPPIRYDNGQWRLATGECSIADLPIITWHLHGLPDADPVAIHVGAHLFFRDTTFLEYIVFLFDTNSFSGANAAHWRALQVVPDSTYHAAQHNPEIIQATLMHLIAEDTD